jgi:excisionase family DNA binding protein
MSVSTLHSQLLSASDRARVVEALNRLEASGTLPELVKEPVLRLLRLASEGREAAVVGIEDDLTTTQAARLLGMSRPFLIKLLDEGRIPNHRTGRDRRVSGADVVKILQEREELKRQQAEAAASYSTRRAERLAAIAGVSAEEATELGFA